ncbi:MAG: ATP-dependent helicase DinG [Campylobacterota bacterium]|nr:ATP-dependent helicase DinG [Campylobacterota bacterium]
MWSFYEVEKITASLKELIPQVNIIEAKKNTPAAQNINRFKKEGGILIGTRNYGTGVNLPKKQLEKLFIVKLPFPIFTTKKWLDIKTQDKKFKTSFYHSAYKNAMIVAFRQWIGRLIRSKEDKGDLYILDSRYNNKRYIKNLEYWLDRMGVIQDEKIAYSTSACSVNTQKETSLKEKIKTAKIEEDIKEYLLAKTEDIIKYNMFPAPDPRKGEFSRDFMRRYSAFKKTDGANILKAANQ